MNVLKAILKFKKKSFSFPPYPLQDSTGIPPSNPNDDDFDVTHHERINYDEMASDSHWLYRDEFCNRPSVERWLFGYPFDKMVMRNDGTGGYRYSPRFSLEKESDAIILSRDGQHYEFLSPFSESEEPEPKIKIYLNVPAKIEKLDRAVQKAVEYGDIKNYGKNGEILFTVKDWLKLISKSGIWVPDGLLAELEKRNQSTAIELMKKMRTAFLLGQGSTLKQISGMEGRVPLGPLGTDTPKSKSIDTQQRLGEVASIEFIKNLKIYCENDVEIMIQIPGKRPTTCNPNYLGFESQNTKEWLALIGLLKTESGVYLHSKKKVKEGGNRDIWKHIKSKLIKHFTDEFNLSLPKNFKLFLTVDGHPGARKPIFQIHRLEEMNDNPYSSFDKVQIEQEIKKQAKFPDTDKSEIYIMAFRRAEELGISNQEIDSWLN